MQGMLKRLGSVIVLYILMQGFQGNCFEHFNARYVFSQAKSCGYVNKLGIILGLTRPDPFKTQPDHAWAIPWTRTIFDPARPARLPPIIYIYIYVKNQIQMVKTF